MSRSLSRSVRSSSRQRPFLRRPGFERLESRLALSAAPFLHPVSAALQVNTTTANDQSDPVVAENATGDTVAVWMTAFSGTLTNQSSSLVISAQRYNAAGVAQGGEITVDSERLPENSLLATSANDTPGVAVDPNGNFVVVWNGTSDVTAQVFHADGTPNGSSFTIGTTSIAFLRGAIRVAADTAGNYLAVWPSLDSRPTVAGQAFDSEGTLRGSSIEIHNAGNPAITAETNGFLVGYSIANPPLGALDGIAVQRFDDQGAVDGAAIQISSSGNYSAIAEDPSGAWYIVWQTQAAIDAQGFAAGDQPATGVIQVSPNSGSLGGLAVAAGGTGDFLIAWPSPDVGSDDLLAQRYDGSGDSIGGVIRLDLAPTVGTGAVVSNGSGDYFAIGPDLDGQGSGVAGEAVAESDSNQAVELTTPIADQPLPARSDVVIDAAQHFQDADGDNLLFTASLVGGGALPAWLQVSDSGDVWGTPELTDAGSDDDIQVTATDGNGSSAVATFNVHVTTGAVFLNGETDIASTSAQYTGYGNPDVSADPRGNYYNLSWYSYYDFPDGPSTTTEYAAQYGALGTQLNQTRHYESSRAVDSPASDSAGDFVALFDGTAQFFPVGNKAVTVNADATLALAEDDADFVLFASANGSYTGQRYDSQGNPLGSTFTLPDFGSLAVTPSGGFIEVGTQSNATTGEDIEAQLFDSQGAPLAAPFQVNTITAGDQTSPAVNVGANGQIVIAWQSQGQDGSGAGIFAQRYDAQGHAEGSEFQVNTFTTGDQELPSVAVSPSGSFFIAWISAGQDTRTPGAYGVYGQYYDPQGTAQGAEMRVNTSTGIAYQSYETNLPAHVAALAGEKFVVVWQSAADNEAIVSQELSFSNPSITVPPAQQAYQNTPLLFSSAGGNAITVSDPLADGGQDLVELTASGGTITLDNTAGLLPLTGNGTADVVIGGTLAAIKAAVDALTFQPASGFTGDVTLTVTVNSNVQRTIAINVAVPPPPTMNQNGSELDVTGSGYFSVAFTDPTDFTVSIGGLSQSYSTAQVDGIDFTGGPGITTAVVSGNVGTAVAVLEAGSGYVSGPTYTVNIAGSAAIYVEADGSSSANELSAALEGRTTGTNSFYSTAASSYLSGGGFFNLVSGAVVVEADSHSGSDTAEIYSAMGDLFASTPTYAYLSGEIAGGDGQFRSAVGFANVYAYSAGGDQAWLYGGTGTNALSESPLESYMSTDANGTTVMNVAEYFPVVYGYAAGANDIAYFYGSPEQYAFVATGAYTYISGAINNGSFFDEAVGFTQSYAQGGGQGIAYLYDTPGDDTFVGTSTYAYMSGGGVFNEADGFSLVEAFSSSGGNDTAWLYDSPGTNAFTGSGGSATLDSGSTSLDTSGFAMVDAVQSQGSDDTKQVDMVDYALTFYGDWTSA